MFYETAAGHPLPHDPFKAIVAPRPIGWISAVDVQGRVNLAPYSFFNAVSDRPHMVAFSSDGEKDALSFARETGEFVCSLATWDLREAMNATSAPLPRGQSEFAHAGLTAAPSRLVAPPRVAESPVALECKLLQVAPLPARRAEGLRRIRGPARRARRRGGTRRARRARGGDRRLPPRPRRLIALTRPRGA